MTLHYTSDNDQWLQGGDCNICRRQKYCSNPCKMSKMRRERITQKLITEAIAKRLFGKEGAAG